MPSACLFNPSPEDTDRVLHRFADHEVSFHDIADEFKTTVPALVLWLAKPEIAQRIADLRSAGAERTRTIAALYLPRTIPVLMRIIDSHDYDIGHRLDDPRDPATPILKLRERESVRKAITLIYRLANFTGVPTPARAAASSSVASSPVASTSSRCRESAQLTAPRATEVGGEADALGASLQHPVNIPSTEESQDRFLGGTADVSTESQPLPPLRGDDSANSPAPDLPSGDFVSSFASSRSNATSPSALLQRAGANPRRSRAGPFLQTG